MHFDGLRLKLLACVFVWEALNIKKVQRYSHTLLKNWSNDWEFCVLRSSHSRFFFFSRRLAGANLLITFGLNFRWFNWTTFELFSRYEVTHTSFIPPEWQRERLSSHFGLGSTSARLCLLFSDQHLRSASIPQLHSEACRGKAGVVFLADQANRALFFFFFPPPSLGKWEWMPNEGTKQSSAWKNKNK